MKYFPLLLLLWAAPAGAQVYRLADMAGTHCSAVAISPGHALTAAHCLTKAQAYVLGSGWSVPVAQSVAHPYADVAILVTGAALPPPYAELDPGPGVAPGDVLYAYGFGLQCAGGKRTMALERRIGHRWLAIGQSVCPGDSGGAVFDRRGYLVGVISARRPGTGISIFVSLFSLFHLVE